ncbi:MAG: hypothetical protein AABW88_05685 [Nanoarchaeota archaeon]
MAKKDLLRKLEVAVLASSLALAGCRSPYGVRFVPGKYSEKSPNYHMDSCLDFEFYKK